MKNSGCWLLIVAICLTGCGVTPAKYTFEASYPDTKHVTFHFTTAQEKNGITILQGSLFHKPIRYERESGHVDIAIYSPDGKLLGESIADYKTPINGNVEWSKTGVRFFAPLGITPPLGSIIKLAFHVEKSSQDSPAEHGVNLAR